MRLASAAAAALLLVAASCGRSPSRLLRLGLPPVYDYPLYLTEGAPGKVWKFDRERNKTLLVSGLNDPRGIATDRSNHLYVVEQGAGRLLQVDVSSGATSVVRDGLSVPTVVAVDSWGEVFVAQDGAKNILRASDGAVRASYEQRPSALAFGVNNLILVGTFDDNKVYWGEGTSTSAAVSEPANLSTDANGRVFVAEGSTTGARILRFHQQGPTGETVVADNLSGVAGMAVDPVGNVYAVEQGASRVIVVTHDGKLLLWTSDVVDPQYIALTQY
jgi:hypothetical protein